jgi:hypothetical protein
MLGVCNTGKKLRVWGEFCAWRAALKQNFDSVGRAAIWRKILD